MVLITSDCLLGRVCYLCLSLSKTLKTAVKLHEEMLVKLHDIQWKYKVERQRLTLLYSHGQKA